MTDVKRSEGPVLSPYDAWLQDSQSLLDRVSDGAVIAAAAAIGPPAAAPAIADADEVAARAEAARTQALALLDLAEAEWQSMETSRDRTKRSKPPAAETQVAPLDSAALYLY